MCDTVEHTPMRDVGRREAANADGAAAVAIGADSGCSHERTVRVGQDAGLNTYLECRDCGGAVLVESELPPEARLDATEPAGGTESRPRTSQEPADGSRRSMDWLESVEAWYDRVVGGLTGRR